MRPSKDQPQYTSVEKVKTPVADLRVGMYVCELDRPWLESPFLFQGFPLNTQEEVESVRQVCRYVYVDRTLSRPAEDSGEPTITPSSKPTIVGTDRVYARKPSHVQVEREIENAVIARRQVDQVVRGFVAAARAGKSLDVEVAADSVARCVESVCQNANAMLLLTQLKHRDEYTSEHSMNVCVLSILLGRQVGLETGNLRYLGLCGLLHDIGKMHVPDRILNKPGPLTWDEDQVMRQHPTLGLEILNASHGIRPEAMSVAFGHHERIDGGGYPRRLEGDQLSLFTRIVSIADCYDAITSERVYKPGLSHMEALSILNRSAGNAFDRGLTLNFVECLGVYPAGSIVEMSNGDVALVLEVNPNQKLRPKVLIVLDCDKREQPPRVVDLSTFALDPTGEPYRIRSTLRGRSLGLDISRYFKYRNIDLAGLG